MIIKICGAVFIAVVFTYCFVRKDPSLSFAVSLAIFVLLGVSVIQSAMPLVDFFGSVAEDAGGKYIPILFKSLGIALVCAGLSSLCKRCNEEPLAGSVELFGKVEILVICLPLVRELLNLCLKEI